MKKSGKSKRGMGAATQGGGCCMPVVKKYAAGSPEEGVTKDMLPWMSKEIGMKRKKDASEGVTKDMLPWMSKELKMKKMPKKTRRLPFEPMIPGRR